MRRAWTISVGAALALVAAGCGKTVWQAATALTAPLTRSADGGNCLDDVMVYDRRERQSLVDSTDVGAGEVIER